MRMLAGAGGGRWMAACGALLAPPASGRRVDRARRADRTSRCRWRCATERVAEVYRARRSVRARQQQLEAGDRGRPGRPSRPAAATDCFLFAQAWAMSGPGSQADGDTLVAHRLARARADAVQAALVRALALPGRCGRQRLGSASSRPRAARDLVDV